MPSYFVLEVMRDENGMASSPGAALVSFPAGWYHASLVIHMVFYDTQWLQEVFRETEYGIVKCHMSKDCTYCKMLQTPESYKNSLQ